MTEPLPNWRSIWPRAVSRACSRSNVIHLPAEPIPRLRTAPRSAAVRNAKQQTRTDRKSTRLNSSHANISYAVFLLKKKKPMDLGISRIIKLLRDPGIGGFFGQLLGFSHASFHTLSRGC